jgi:hypothetical protein
MYPVCFFILMCTPANPHLSSFFMHHLQPYLFKGAQGSLMDLIDLVGGEDP